MRFTLHLLGLIAVALAVGFGLSLLTLGEGRSLFAYRVGPWQAWAGLGSVSPDPYARAHLARAGTLQLGAGEGLRFTATTDSDGRRLDRSCRYRIDGMTPVASFWTLVATSPDGINIARNDAPLALRSSRIARASDGSIVAYVSRTLAPWNWLEITGTGPFVLILTLYDTSLLAGVGAGDAVMPAILIEGCA